MKLQLRRERLWLAARHITGAVPAWSMIRSACQKRLTLAVRLTCAAYLRRRRWIDRRHCGRANAMGSLTDIMVASLATIRDTCSDGTSANPGSSGHSGCARWFDAAGWRNPETPIGVILDGAALMKQPAPANAKLRTNIVFPTDTRSGRGPSA